MSIVGQNRSVGQSKRYRREYLEQVSHIREAEWLSIIHVTSTGEILRSNNVWGQVLSSKQETALCIGVA